MKEFGTCQFCWHLQRTPRLPCDSDYVVSSSFFLLWLQIRNVSLFLRLNFGLAMNASRDLNSLSCPHN